VSPDLAVGLLERVGLKESLTLVLSPLATPHAKDETINSELEEELAQIEEDYDEERKDL